MQAIEVIFKINCINLYKWWEKHRSSPVLLAGRPWHLVHSSLIVPLCVKVQPLQYAYRDYHVSVVRIGAQYTFYAIYKYKLMFISVYK